MYGDQTIDEPSSFNLRAHLMWSAWDEVKGKSKEDCIKEGLTLTETILKEKGYALDEPSSGDENCPKRNLLELKIDG